MGRLFNEVIDHGLSLKTNIFTTENGVYTIHLKEYDGNIFFVKYRNGEIDEFVNLSELVAYADRDLGI